MQPSVMLMGHCIVGVFSVATRRQESVISGLVMAGVLCAAVNCSNRRSTCGALSFFRFPKDADRLVVLVLQRFSDRHNDFSCK